MLVSSYKKEDIHETEGLNLSIRSLALRVSSQVVDGTRIAHDICYCDIVKTSTTGKLKYNQVEENILEGVIAPMLEKHGRNSIYKDNRIRLFLRNNQGF